MTRYKIDHYGPHGRPFALFREFDREVIFGVTRKEWSFVRSFSTRDEAREFYEKIKDLPEYLGGE